LREALAASRARSVVVVLDCCFSDRARPGVVAASDDAFTMAAVRDSFLVTAATREGTALAAPGERHTAFTGVLLELLRNGDPTGPPGLTLSFAFLHLTRTLRNMGRPEPRRQVSGGAGDIMLARNPAYQPPDPREFASRRAKGSGQTGRPTPPRPAPSVCPGRY